jgi:ribosomal protein L7Ae-like RNA K-turn-binding protein
MTNSIYPFLGLATKAGKLFSGEDVCERMLKNGKAVLVIVAEDASANTGKKFEDMCKYRGIDFRIFGKKELLGKFTGKDIRSVVAVIDTGFAARLVELIDNHSLEFGGELNG